MSNVEFADADADECDVHSTFMITAVRWGRMELIVGRAEHRLRATAEGLLGRTASALAAAEARVKATPEDAEARAQLGGAYRQAGRPTQAIDSYRSAVRLDPLPKCARITR